MGGPDAPQLKIPPEDILKEVTFYVGGGGGYCPTTDSGPVITNVPYEAEIMQPVVLKTCGWQEQQTLTGTVQYPDGRVISQTIDTNLREALIEGNVRNYLEANLYFKATFDDPEGVYVLRLEGKNGTFQSKVYYHLPTAPRFYWVAFDRKYIYLHGFSSNEKVKLIYFKHINTSEHK